eukprot:augustus_masked-scaffold_2-processed-gene-7.11-mRNA-1 protein AED:0.82 eAED:0.85 QI:0/-1/0/1/-1/1/1/0/530
MGSYPSVDAAPSASIFIQPLEQGCGIRSKEEMSFGLYCKVINVDGLPKQVHKTKRKLSLRGNVVSAYLIRLSLWRKVNGEEMLVNSVRTFSMAEDNIIWYNCCRLLCAKSYPGDLLVVELLKKKKQLLEKENSNKIITHMAKYTLRDMDSKVSCFEVNLSLKKVKTTDAVDKDDEQGARPMERDCGELKQVHCSLKIYFSHEHRNSLEKEVDLFFIRHGQSTWNQAQESGNLVGMMRQIDHPLNEVGFRQSQDFAEKVELLGRMSVNERSEAENKFLDAQRLFCSSLQRAVQTALVCLKSHTIFARDLEQGSIKVSPLLREIQNYGGLDSMGSAFGKEILKRVKETLPAEISDEVLCKNIDKFCTKSVTGFTLKMKEKEKSIDKRIDELLNLLFFTNSESFILVGHSLFLKHFMQRLENGFEAHQGEENILLSHLQENKLGNLGCIHIRVNILLFWPENLNHKKPNLSSSKREHFSVSSVRRFSEMSMGRRSQITNVDKIQNRTHQDTNNHKVSAKITNLGSLFGKIKTK